MSPRSLSLVATLLALSACTTTPMPVAPVTTDRPSEPATTPAAPAAATPETPVAAQAPAGIPVSGKLNLGTNASGFHLSAVDVRTGQTIDLSANNPQAPVTTADGSFSLTLPASLVGKTIRLTALSADTKTEASALIEVVSATTFKALQTAAPTLTIDTLSTLICKLVYGPLMPLQLLKPEAAAPLFSTLAADLRGAATAILATLQSNTTLSTQLTANDSSAQLSDAEAASVQAVIQASGVTSQVNQAVATLLSGIAKAYQEPGNRSGAGATGDLAAQLAAVPLPGTTLSVWIDPAAGAFRMTNRQSGTSVDLTSASSASVTSTAAATSGSGGGGGGGGGGGTVTPTFTVPDGNPITLNFKAKVGTEDLVCTASAAVGGTPTYANVGLDSKTIRPYDFRYYVHDLKLLKTDGTTIDTTLSANNWQYQNLALIDHETNVTAGENTAVSFTAPVGTYTGIRFTLGVPAALNHLALAAGDAAHAILQSDDHGTGMAWAWLSGRKYTKIEFAIPQPDTTEKTFLIHLGGTGATNPTKEAGTYVGFDPLQTTLASANLPTITLDGFNPATDSVWADLKAFLANVNVVDGGSYMPAPMSASGGNDTDIVLKNFGLAGGSTQKLFKKGN